MRLIEKEHCYIFDGLFGSAVIAGFTKVSLEGNLPQDIIKALSFLNRNSKIAYLKQIHSSHINSIEKEGVYKGDGLFTKVNDLALVVRTADCLPIFLSSEILDRVGVIHMGWRSAKEGILDNIGFDLASFKVVAGAGLRKCCYKVGKEFLDYPRLGIHTEKRNNDFYFDPISFAKIALINSGLKEENFSDTNICSFCSKDNFFSFRRSATSSRTLSFILK